MSRGKQAHRPLGQGSRIGVYEILDRLGAGGMGEVWLARDTRLGRKVALKTLLEEFSGDEVRRRRFETEARTVAALNHPNIVTLHSVEHEDGVRFLTMEYVQGRTLDALIPAGGLDARTFFDLAVPLTEAVAVAHRRNIAHRDLKPGNVMVTDDGRVKVVDFGLATDRGLTEVDDGPTVADQTQEGMLVGTVHYMSPEQLRGQRADRSSDVFALGVVCYEMLTGRRPFEGSGLAELASSILRDDPPPVGRFRSDLPDCLWTLLARCLEKERARRPLSADVVLPELVRARQQFVSGQLGGALMLEERGDEVNRRVAVLEFTNIADDPEVEWIATGIAETLTVDLNKVRGVAAVSRHKVAKATAGAGDDRDEVAIGRRLDVDTVVTGTIQRAGRSLRVTAQCLDLEEDRAGTSFRIDGSLDRIFEMQDRVVERLSELLGCPDETRDDDHQATRVIPKRVPEHVYLDDAPRSSAGKLEAFECFAKARRLINRMNPSDFLKARDLLSRAAEIEPDYAMAHAGLGQALGMSYIATTDPDDLEAAIGHLSRAVELDPESAAPYPFLSYCLMRADRLAEAVEAGRRGLHLDPDDSLSHYMLAVALWVQACREFGSDNWAEVFEHFAASERLTPRYQAAGQLLGSALLYRGRYSEARGPLERAADVEASEDFELSRFVGAHMVLGRLEYLEGNVDAAERMARRSLEVISGRDHVYTVAMVALTRVLLADVLCRRGNCEDALTELRTAVEGCVEHASSLGIGAILVRVKLALARCLDQLRMVPEARTLYEEATDLFRTRSEYDFSWTIEVSDGDLYREMALYHAVAGHPDEAVASLRKAMECGWSDRRFLDAEPFLASVRDRPDFAELRTIGEPVS